MKTRLIVATLVVALTALLENFVEAQEEPQNISTNSLPDSLPMIGSQQAFREWIATNRECLVGCSIRYTNTMNQRVEINPFAQQKNFTSYADFGRYITERGMILWGYMQSRADFTESTHVYFGGQTYYRLGDGLGGGFGFVRKNIGPVSNITSNSFIMEPEYARVSIHMPGIEVLEITVGTDPLLHNYYHYRWTKDEGGYSVTNIKPQPLPESMLPFTPDKDSLVLNEWYSTNTANRVRFTIKRNDQSRTYTQYGDALKSVLGINPKEISVVMARGSDVIIQSSPNMSYWQELARFDWSLGCKNNGVAIAPYSPRQFYRAVSD